MEIDEGDAVPDLAGLFDELIRFEIELWNAVDTRLRADCDLPLSRFEPMRVITRRAPCRVQDIAEEMSITVGGVSKLVDRIEAAGHCRRRPNPDDKRSSVIEPTPAGRRLLAAAVTSFEDELRIRLGSAVDATSLRQFSATLTRLRSAGHRADSTE
ncbi:MarR family winged helix-turn-helix transcriptional regulator [Streptomyces sp. NBC_01622]|uniref:MarR family winged helix-turn-helix transcriptional regulator n=1 Tax=Streptomyces sp. NBC_01622 TaxID=2975903 RepID=UPI00387088A0|nr:MarR family winged helix-turn-helix transcriptional regulator [Streptomyces sp. NBC_01622]